MSKISRNAKECEPFINRYLNLFRLHVVTSILVFIFVVILSPSLIASGDDSFTDFIPRSNLPTDLTLAIETYSFDKNLNSSTATITYNTNSSYFPVYLKIYKFENKENAKIAYGTAIKDFQSGFSTVKFDLNKTLNLQGQSIEQYSVEIYGNVKNKMYTWQDNNFVFIAMGPNIEDKNLAFELVNRIYEKPAATIYPTTTYKSPGFGAMISVIGLLIAAYTTKRR